MTSASINLRPPAKAVLFLSAVALFIGGGILYAGPLDPPAGPVVPTHKTLTEVEPRTAINAVNTPGDADSVFKITQPGSYYLTGNITGVAGKHGIEIAASAVTLDLNGFVLSGVPGTLAGVYFAVGGSFLGASVSNGRIESWGSHGVDGELVSRVRLSGIQAVANGGCGISVQGLSIIRDCITDINGLDGIRAGSFSIVESCASSANFQNGFRIDRGSNVSSCIAVSNGAIGFAGRTGSSFVVSRFSGCVASKNLSKGFELDRVTMDDCRATGNDGVGIDVLTDSVLSRCVARANNGIGISVTDGGTVINCSAATNGGVGISAGVGSSIIGCIAQSNNTSGIATSSSSSIVNCVARATFGTGITTGSNCTVSGCTASENQTMGILVPSDCVVSSNTCIGNGTAIANGAGILSTGSSNRIEGNNCSNNDRGIECAAAGNLIIRNSASNNTINFLFVANNRYGPIVDITGATAAVNGNSAASTMTTTDPHANFRY